MLMVICGAGASYDSVLPAERKNLLRSVPHQRPPLARDLFDDRPYFNERLKAYRCDGLAAHLRGVIQNPDKDLETELENLVSQAPNNTHLQHELLGLRYYLQAAIWECSKWGLSASGITNYLALIRLIDIHRKDEDVCFVTFNYDTLIEQSLVRYKSESLISMDDYITGHYRLYKLHGSVDWGREIREAYGAYLDGDPLRLKVIERGKDLPVGNVYVKGEQPSARSGAGRPLLPAIAIPVIGKTQESFQCPEEHVSSFISSLKDLRKLLVIGWRGEEAHFLQLLDRPRPPAYPRVLVVSKSEESAESTAQRLRDRDLCTSPRVMMNGFSGLIGSDELVEFLAT